MIWKKQVVVEECIAVGLSMEEDAFFQSKCIVGVGLITTGLM